MALEYTGTNQYQNKLIIYSNNTIIANGIAPIGFTRIIMEKLVFGANYITKWSQLFNYEIWIK